jgi:hypothetical protein
MLKLQLLNRCSSELCIKETLADETDFGKPLFSEYKDANINIPFAWNKNSGT